MARIIPAPHRWRNGTRVPWTNAMDGAPGDIPPRTIHARVPIHRGTVFAVERVTFRDGTGRDIVRDVVRHPGAVTVIPVLDDGRLVMIRNWRVAVGGWLDEFCAGKLEPGEDPAVAAGRELEEETGHSAARLRAVGTFFTSPGFADERMHVFEARGLSRVPQRLEEGEQIEVVLRTVAELESMIASGELTDGKTIGAYALWKLGRDARA
jgi:ADP-ribose pyrophosphatase